MEVTGVSPLKRIEASAFYLVLFVGTGFIIWDSRDYFLPDRIHGFILERIELAVQDWWRDTLVVHVAGGLLCLLSSLLQYSGFLLRRAPAIHRNLGRIYALSIAVLVFPTGVALAFVAKGGWPGTVGFLVLSAATLGSLILGMVAIYRKDLPSHQAWISRSFALVTTAITFRALQLGLMQFEFSYERIYQTALWGSIGINLALCEFYLLNRKTQKP